MHGFHCGSSAPEEGGAGPSVLCLEATPDGCSAAIGPRATCAYTVASRKPGDLLNVPATSLHTGQRVYRPPSTASRGRPEIPRKAKERRAAGRLRREINSAYSPARYSRGEPGRRSGERPSEKRRSGKIASCKGKSGMSYGIAYFSLAASVNPVRHEEIRVRITSAREPRQQWVYLGALAVNKVRLPAVCPRARRRRPSPSQPAFQVTR